MSPRTSMIALASTLALAAGCAAAGPCEETAVMACIDDDGFGCHEFYSDDAAAAVRGSCISLGSTITMGPCPATYTHCCYHPDGSFGNPEAICIRATEPEAATWESDCLARTSYLYCMR